MINKILIVFLLIVLIVSLILFLTNFNTSISKKCPKNPKNPCPKCPSCPKCDSCCPKCDSCCPKCDSCCPKYPPTTEVYFAPLNDTNHCALSDAECQGTTACKWRNSKDADGNNCIMGTGLDIKANLIQEVDLIKNVTNYCLKETDPSIIKLRGNNAANPYKIRYSVYNLLMADAITALITASNAGVYIQVLIEASQTDPCKTYNSALQSFNNAGLQTVCWKFPDNSVTCENNPPASCPYTCSTPIKCSGSGSTNGESSPKPLSNCSGRDKDGEGVITGFGGPSQWDFDMSASPNLDQYNFFTILSVAPQTSYPGIMHTKMRLFNWNENSESRTTVITGSLNPDDSAIYNEETLFVIKDHPIFNQYENIYNAILHLTDKQPTKYKFINPKIDLQQNNMQLMFSKGDLYNSSTKLTSSTIGFEIINLIKNQNDMVLIFVYTMRDFGGLVDAIYQAAAKGAFVAVLTDLDQIVGEAGFGAPDNTCLAGFINSIPLGPKFLLNGKKTFVPVYPCKNINGQFSAFHHKNMVSGVGTSSSPFLLTSDSANWTKGALGNGGGPWSPAGMDCEECKCTLTNDDYYCDKQYCGSPPDCNPKSESVGHQKTRFGGKGAAFTAPPPPQSRSRATIQERYSPSCFGEGNASSETPNCETTLFINSTTNDQNEIGLKFVEVFMYLLKKHWVFTINGISKITKGGKVLYGPPTTLDANGLSITTNCEVNSGSAGCGSGSISGMCGLPTKEVVKNIYSPSQIGTMMSKIKNMTPKLAKMVSDLSQCNIDISDPETALGTCTQTT